MKNRYAKMSLGIAGLILIDQLVKLAAIMQDRMSENNKIIENFGGAFGIGGNNTLFFILANFVILGIIIKFILVQKDRVDKKTLISYTFVLAGGFSNLIDRICRGFVIDYIDISRFFKFPIFNIADIYIFVGWVLLFISILIYWGKEVKSKKTKREENP